MGLSALLAAAMCVACSGGSFVDRIVIDNPTAFTANVDVTGAERDAELERTHWRVEVPASFEAALRDRGVSPPP